MNGYTTIGEIKRANRLAGKHWYSPNTVKLFRPKIESAIYVERPRDDYPHGTRSWVESTRNHDNTQREYKLVRFNVDTHDIAYIHDGNYNTYRYPTRREALTQLRHIVAEVQQCSTT